MTMVTMLRNSITVAVLALFIISVCVTAQTKTFFPKAVKPTSTAPVWKKELSSKKMLRATNAEIQNILHADRQKRNSEVKQVNKQENGKGKNISGRTPTRSQQQKPRSAMSDLANFTIMHNVDMADAGYGGMRDEGDGLLTITIGTGAVTILQAYLYWNGPTNSLDPEANATVTFNGSEITGTSIGFSDDNCWDYLNSQAYRADVTAYVSPDDTTYTLDGFIKNGGNVNINGATLIVFYDDGDTSNNHDYVLFDGNDSNIENQYDEFGWNVMLKGISYTSGTATMTLHVSDGQIWTDDNIYLNGIALTDTDQIFAGTTVPYDTMNADETNGSMWDIVSFDITPYMAEGNNDILISTGEVNDCLSLVLAVVELPVGAAPVEFGTAKITGLVFNDGNNNGVRDSTEEESPLSGWDIVLSGSASDTVTSDPSGRYTFSNLLPGSYTVSEIMKDGWSKTLPLTAEYSFTVDSGQIFTNVDFGNYPHPGSISGVKWNDEDSDGQWDEDEQGIEGWKIYLSYFDYGTYSFVALDSATTDEDGEYVIENIPLGSYYVLEEMKADWIQTQPGSGYYYLTLVNPGEEIEDINFGNFQELSDFSYETSCKVFPTLQPGTSMMLPLKVYNNGTAPGNILGFYSTDVAFTAEIAGDSIVESGEVAIINITFAPSEPGEYISFLFVATSSSIDTILLAGQGELDATGTGQQIFSGLAKLEGDNAPKNSIIVALTSNFDLIKAALIQIPPDSIEGNINYAISLQEGQAGLEEGDTIFFGISSGCSFQLERFCGYTTFNPSFPPPDGFTRHDLDAVEYETVSTNLREGFNAVSWNVLPENRAVASVFANLLWSNNVKIILDFVNDGNDSPHFDFYIPALGEYNPLQTTDVRKGYFVRTLQEPEEPFKVWGQQVCNELPIALNRGYNFISYLPYYDYPVEHALQSLLPNNLTIALDWVHNSESGEGGFEFYPAGGFTTMKEGKGYFVRVDSSATLVYPEYEGASSSSKQRHAINSSEVASTDIPQAVFAYGMNLTINGSLIPQGTEIKAVDRDGVVCGTTHFMADGVFALPIIADNSATPQDEGAEQDEYVALYVDNQLLGARIQWTGFGDTPELKGDMSVLGIGEPGATPDKFLLHQNYPNPFNPTTAISYELPASAFVTVKIYDMLGVEVQTLIAGAQHAGHYQITWDGRNSSGYPVSSGIYTYRMTADNSETSIVQTKKMVLLK